MMRPIFGLEHDYSIGVMVWGIGRMTWDLLCEPIYGLGEDGGLTVIIWDI
jgi:hypothetical protein